MRESCANCTRKHLANAVVLSHEVLLGYKEFSWLVVGHLCQAEEEMLRDNMPLATMIREHRLQYIDCINSDFSDLSVVPNFMPLIEMVTAFFNEHVVDPTPATETPAQEDVPIETR